jgi:hypothetical protein
MTGDETFRSGTATQIFLDRFIQASDQPGSPAFLMLTGQTCLFSRIRLIGLYMLRVAI